MNKQSAPEGPDRSTVSRTSPQMNAYWGVRGAVWHEFCCSPLRNGGLLRQFSSPATDAWLLVDFFFYQPATAGFIPCPWHNISIVRLVPLSVFTKGFINASFRSWKTFDHFEKILTRDITRLLLLWIDCHGHYFEPKAKEGNIKRFEAREILQTTAQVPGCVYS